MKTRILMSACLVASLAAATGYARAAGPDAVSGDVRLSPDLANLLREEMRELSGGVQTMALAIAGGDWQSIQATSARIRASYILDRKLTSGQAAELNSALPAPFKALDAAFHARAGKIGAAAAARDAEQVVFHYSRLLESCTVCHAGYAKARFPGLAPTGTATATPAIDSPASTEHEHHH